MMSIPTDISEGIYILIFGIIALFISTQIEYHNDLFYIKQECQYVAIVTSIGTIMISISLFLSKLNVLFHIASYLTFIFTILITSCISSVYVLVKSRTYDVDIENNLNFTVSLQQTKLSETADNYESSLDIDNKTSVETNPAIISVDTLTYDEKNEIIPLEWMMIVKDKSGFALFMNYLVTEYSHENLIFISEVIQFKLWFEQKLLANNIEKILTDPEFGVIYKLPNSLPISSIITDVYDDTENDEFLRAQMLFNKYIKRDEALYEVNISDEQRSILETYFNENTVNTFAGDLEDHKWQNQLKLLKIYDEALKEIEWLLKDGFTRFQQSDAFHRYWKKKKASRFTDKLNNFFSASSSFVSDTECSTTIHR